MRCFSILLALLIVCRPAARAGGRSLTIRINYIEAYDAEGEEVGGYKYLIKSKTKEDIIAGASLETLLKWIPTIGGYDEMAQGGVIFSKGIFVKIESNTEIEKSEMREVLLALSKNPLLRISSIELGDTPRIVGLKILKFYGLN